MRGRGRRRSGKREVGEGGRKGEGEKENEKEREN